MLFNGIIMESILTQLSVSFLLLHLLPLSMFGNLCLLGISLQDIPSSFGIGPECLRKMLRRYLDMFRILLQAISQLSLAKIRWNYFEVKCEWTKESVYQESWLEDNHQQQYTSRLRPCRYEHNTSHFNYTIDFL